MKRIEILGIPFNPLTVEETLTTLEGFLSTSQNHIVVTPNPECVMQARRNLEYANAIKSADLSLPDGTGIVMAAKFKRLEIHGRVRGTDAIFGIFERLSQKNRNFTAYFLGAKPGVAEKAKENMEKKYHGLNVIGLHHGYFTDDTEIIEEINHLSPDFLLVCTGMPRAELWATANRNTNARITMCLGGVMDIMGGTFKLAPPLFRKLGLEWFYRLITQPSRVKRQLDIPRFILAVLFSRRLK